MIHDFYSTEARTELAANWLPLCTGMLMSHLHLFMRVMRLCFYGAPWHRAQENCNGWRHGEHKMHTAPALAVKISADNPRQNGWAVCKYLIWERIGEVDKRYDDWRNVTRNDGIRPYCRAVISFIYKWMNSGQLSNSSLDTLNELRSKKSPLTMNTKPIDVELMSAASYKSNRQ